MIESEVHFHQYTVKSQSIPGIDTEQLTASNVPHLCNRTNQILCKIYTFLLFIIIYSVQLCKDEADGCKNVCDWLNEGTDCVVNSLSYLVGQEGSTYRK